MDLEFFIQLLDTRGFVGVLVAGTILGGLWISQKWIEELIKIKAEEKRKKMEFVLEVKLAIMQRVNEKVWEMEAALSKYISLWGEIRGEQRTKEGHIFLEKAQEFLELFEPNRIYFPKDLAEKIHKLYVRYRECVIEFSTQVHHADVTTNSSKWIELNDYVKKESPEVRRGIEDEIRKHMF